jgi:hypothetical protein
MDKKNILSNASAALQKRPNCFVRAGRWCRRQAAAFWRWLRNSDKLVFFNIILLLLVCVMFFIMLGQVKTAKKSALTNKAQVVETRPASRAALAKNRPTIVVSRNGAAMVGPEILIPERPSIAWRKKITLPLNRVPRAVPVIKKKIPGTLIVNGHGRKAKLSSMTTIGGDLILQNMRTFVLPCGTRVNGNLLLRNVRLLKFCGCFDIAGNIYVSSDSSFGPIPKDAHLGGQVIF